MKKKNLLGMLGMLSMGAMLSHQDFKHPEDFTRNKNISDRKENSNSLMKRFIIQGVEIWALNQKLANKKAKKLGLISKY